jgi:hypothetical protein
MSSKLIAEFWCENCDCMEYGDVKADVPGLRYYVKPPKGWTEEMVVTPVPSMERVPVFFCSNLCRGEWIIQCALAEEEETPAEELSRFAQLMERVQGKRKK